MKNNKFPPNLAREYRPEFCEMWILDKVTKRPRRCANKIDFIWTQSGGFLCIDCVNKLHKRYPNCGKFLDPTKYLKKYKKNIQ